MNQYLEFNEPINLVNNESVETKIKFGFGSNKIMVWCCSFCGEELDTQKYRYKFGNTYKFFCNEKCAIFSKLGE